MDKLQMRERFERGRTNPSPLPQKDLLRQIGLSQTEVADRLGCQRGHLCNVLNGRIVSKRLVGRLNDLISEYDFMLSQ